MHAAASTTLPGTARPATQAGEPGTTNSTLLGRRTFDGSERQLGELRRWLASLTPPGPARDDLTSIATELGTNAIQHTASGHDGTFTVELTRAGVTLRLAVTDQGSATRPRLINDPAAERGRGLLIVHALAGRTGVIATPRGHCVWAEVTDHPDPASPDRDTPNAQPD